MQFYRVPNSRDPYPHRSYATSQNKIAHSCPPPHTYLRPPRRHQHLSRPRPLQPIDTQMLHTIPPYVHPKRIPRDLPLPRRDAHQARHEVRFRPRLAKRHVARHLALVHEADDIADGADVVREIALRVRPQREERERVDDDEYQQRVVRGHGGYLADALRWDVELRGEDATAEDGDGDGKQAVEGYPGHAVVAGERGPDANFQGKVGRVAKEEGLLGGGAAGVSESGEGLQSAVVHVDRLPGEKQEHAKEGRDEAV